MRSHLPVGTTRTNRQHILRRAALCACEQLEGRRLLTSTLYIDYGDRFAGGVLNTTVGDLDSHTNGSNPDIDGPVLSDPSNNNYSGGTGVVITALNTLYPVTGAALRATMDALVQRYYAPLDITVVDLTASFQTVNGHSVRAAADLDDISATLGVNEGDAKNNDSYVIVGRFIVNGSDNPSGRYGGISTGTDIASNNNNDGTALVLLGGSGDSATFNGDQIAHESGHAFGLRHVYRQDVGNAAPAISNTSASGAQYDRLHQSELMSYLGYNSQGGFNFFSRYPTMQGDGNTDANTVTAAPDEIDHFYADGTIGRSNMEYVTGTGENDIITITKTGATTANVSVSAFDDAGYTVAVDAPGSTGNTFSYAISLTMPLVIDAGGRNDRIVLDGDLGNNITVRGMQGTDTLVIDGKGGTGVYTPGLNTANGLDGNSDRRGNVQIGSTNISFQEFDPTSTVTITNMASLTYRTPGSSDGVTLGDGASAGQNQVTATSDGVTMVPLLFSGVTTFGIDTGTNDAGSPADAVTLSASAPATGMTNLNVSTGAGNDDVLVNFAAGNPVPVNGLSYDGGTGTGDRLDLRNGNFTNDHYVATGPGAGSISLDSTLINYVNLAPITDTVNAANLIFDATNGADDIDFSNGPVVAGFQTDAISSGNATFESLDFANKTTVEVNGQGGADVFEISATTAADGMTSVTFNGQNGSNSLDDDAGDTFHLNATIAGMPTKLTGGGGRDFFEVDGSGVASGSNPVLFGQSGDDTFGVTSSANSPINVDGGTHTFGDTLNVDGETLDYDINPASFTTSGRQPINYTAIETLGITDGTFEVPGTIAPNVIVGTDATLYGTGTVQGAVTVNFNGIVSPGISTGSATGIFNTGSVNFLGGGTTKYQVQLNGLGNGTGHDVLNVTGTVTLGGATLDATATFNPLPGEELMIIHNDGADPVVGKFAQGDIVTIGTQKFAIDYAYDGDGDGKLNDVALIKYGAELGPDPCDPTKTALFVSATTGDDNVLALPVTGTARIRIVIQAISQGFTDEFGPFDFDGSIIMSGQSGNDLVSAQAVPSRDVMLYGNVGNDRIVGGNNNSILVGNVGNDILIGGNARDLLIGGSGADNLTGDNAGDILVSASTIYDSFTAAHQHSLCDILHTWQQGGRMSTLLNASSVNDDTDVDTVSGGNGTDWFIIDLNDLTDAAKNEVLSDL